MEYEKRIIRLQEVVRLRRKYKQWRIKNIKAPPTYFPSGPFKLIKEYVGFDPTYRHKKIAGFIKSELGEISMWQHRNNGAAWTRPFQWEWHDAYNNLKAYKTPEKKAAVLAFSGEVRYNSHLYDLECIVARRQYAATVRPWAVTKMTHWNYKLMIMLSPKKCKIHKITIADLKQYCRENNMVGYSRLNKTQLCHFILKYEF